MTKHLKDYSIIKGVIRCETGLHIGGTKETLEIGGLDSPVIKHPVSGMPYIPGSSIKGKLRSLLELKYGKFENNGDPYTGRKNGQEDSQCPISRIFGPHKNTRHNFGPTRILVRDANLTPKAEEILNDRKLKMGTSFLELKQETAIDRTMGVAKGTSLRSHERVPEGTEFSFEIVIRNFEWGFPNETQDNLDKVTEAMKLLTFESLGGSGSRGYGKISFQEVTLDGNPYEIR